jgi:hypothetical protein
MMRTARIVGMLIQIVAFALAVLPELPSQAEDSNVVERFKVDKDGRALLVPVNVAGKEYPC